VRFSIGSLDNLLADLDDLTVDVPNNVKKAAAKTVAKPIPPKVEDEYDFSVEISLPEDLEPIDYAPPPPQQVQNIPAPVVTQPITTVSKATPNRRNIPLPQAPATKKLSQSPPPTPNNANHGNNIPNVPIPPPASSKPSASPTPYAVPPIPQKMNSSPALLTQQISNTPGNKGSIKPAPPPASAKPTVRRAQANSFDSEIIGTHADATVELLRRTKKEAVSREDYEAAGKYRDAIKEWNQNFNGAEFAKNQLILNQSKLVQMNKRKEEALLNEDFRAANAVKADIDSLERENNILQTIVNMANPLGGMGAKNGYFTPASKPKVGTIQRNQSPPTMDSLPATQKSRPVRPAPAPPISFATMNPRTFAASMPVNDFPSPSNGGFKDPNWPKQVNMTYAKEKATELKFERINVESKLETMLTNVKELQGQMKTVNKQQQDMQTDNADWFRKK